MRSTIAIALLSLALGATQPEPRITAISPETPVVSTKAQVLTVTGTDFKTGLTVYMTTPGGKAKTFQGNEVLQPTSKSFRVSAILDAIGKYEFVVMNEDGFKSAPYGISVRNAARQPAIEQVTPPEIFRKQDEQAITLTGRNFDAGLKVSLTDPTGTVMTAPPDKIEPQTLTARLTFPISGSYALIVTNPGGESSNSVTITVR